MRRALVSLITLATVLYPSENRYMHLNLFKISLKRRSKKYYHYLLCLGLACILLFTSVEVGEAQQTNSTTRPSTNTNSARQAVQSPASKPASKQRPIIPTSGQVSSTTSSQQTDSEAPTLPSVTSIKSISPKEFYISIPQLLEPLQSYRSPDDKNYKQEPINVVVTGDNFPSQLDQIKIKIGNPPNIVSTKVTAVTKDGKAIFATFNNKLLQNLNRGIHPVRVEVRGNAATVDRQLADDELQVNELQVKVKRPVSKLTTLFVFVLTMGCMFLTSLIIYMLVKEAKKANLPNTPSPGNRKNLNTLEWIVLDRETNTFSLARAQFVWWLTIIVFGYLFLFIGRGFVQGVWEFIPLSGFAYTFLISLITLVTAQATSGLRGSKGAGEIHPAWSDLVVHGGVIALERIQQVIWNIIIGIAFIVILLVTYTTASSLPSIPPELLTLIGISSAGYIGGKVVRKPGPNINQVVLYKCEEGNTLDGCITIAGTNFSLGGKILNSEGKEEDYTNIRDSGVIVQMLYLNDSKEEIPNTLVEIKKDDTVTLELDPDTPMEFCRKLRINLKNLEYLKRFPDNWLKDFYDNFDKRRVEITVINADGQRAVWDGSSLAPERLTAQQMINNS